MVFFSSRRRHARWRGDWSSDVCSSDLPHAPRRRRPLRDGATTGRVAPACGRSRQRVVWKLAPPRCSLVTVRRSNGRGGQGMKRCRLLLLSSAVWLAAGSGVASAAAVEKQGYIPMADGTLLEYT